MGFGRHLRELSKLRLSMVLCVLLAALAALWSVADVSVLPPKVSPRSLEMSTAFTQVVVDTPQSAILDLRQGTDDILGLKNRAVLVGTVMASPPVREFIARRANIDPEVLEIGRPRTPESPRPVADPGSKKGPGDLLKSTDEYRLDIQANPTVPILNVYAQAPSAQASAELANAAVDGLQDYLNQLGRDERTPETAQVRLRQLGRAEGDVLNEGVSIQTALIAFIGILGLSSAAAMFISRVRRGWVLAEGTGT
jgi:hypothetical protein